MICKHVRFPGKRCSVRVAGEGDASLLWALPGDVARSGSQVSSAQSRHSLYCSEGWSGEKVAYVGLSVNPNHSLSPSLVSHRAILKEAPSPQTPQPGTPGSSYSKPAA